MSPCAGARGGPPQPAAGPSYLESPSVPPAPWHRPCRFAPLPLPPAVQYPPERESGSRAAGSPTARAVLGPKRSGPAPPPPGARPCPAMPGGDPGSAGRGVGGDRPDLRPEPGEPAPGALVPRSR
ncbi:hypothetical protein P7K49_035682 [Saguinus oedipus]|uniref:Basic proline-rich protein-like n=1 Tax=Saguinus oedipus TaxID=9490 RepID=A0ABQ9TPX9_SAGOE|nr:hypothetical protein P7K49_035682 [Saguinus oedipus]